MRYPLSSPHSLHADAVKAGIKTLRSGRYTMGPAVAAFEQAFAKRVGAKHAVMVNSGSSANLLAVEAMLRPAKGTPRWTVGDEVLVPALAWSTTVWPLVQLGLVPVFVDSDPVTLALDLDHAERMVSPKTVGMMLIHVLGCPSVSASGFCERHGLTLIEDCCEAMGAHVGLDGLLSTYSHFFSHQLTTMEGGTVTTDDDAIADDLRSMRAHGWTRNRQDKDAWHAGSAIDPSFLFVTTGYNVRPLEIEGAMGLVQLQHLDADITGRRAMVREMRATVSGSPVSVIGYREHGHSWMNCPLSVSGDQKMVIETFQRAGIETRPIIAGNLLRHPVMARVQHRADVSYPVADDIMAQGFMMGSHWSTDGLVALREAVDSI